MWVEVECSPSLWAAGDDRAKLALQERPSREADGWLTPWAAIPKIGEKLGWHLVVDCIILSDDGGLRGAVGAVRAAPLPQTARGRGARRRRTRRRARPSHYYPPRRRPLLIC